MTAGFTKCMGLAVLMAGALPAASHAADIAPPPATSDWTFSAAAYLWAAGLEGKAGVFGLPPQDIDVSFGDVVQNLNFAAMGLAEARKGAFSLGMDLTYTDLGGSVDTPRGIVADKLDASVTSWMVTGFAGYSVVDTGMLRLDALAGARFWSVDDEFKLKGGLLDGTSKSEGASWVDPLAGARLRIDFTPELYSTSWAMIGGFGAGSDLMWDVMAGAGYQFTDHFSLFAGYRAVSVDYSHDGFVYDAVQKGPILAGVFQF